MTGVWFTFGPDGPALMESVAVFRETGGTRVCLFDDANNPLSDDVVARIKPDLRESTSWPRNGNLKGWENTLGELACMEKAAIRFGTEGVMKIDSDTLVFSFDPWLDTSAPMCGFMAGGGAYVYGMSYHIRLEAIRAARESLTTRWLDYSERIHEDQAISSEVFWKFGPAVKVTSWKEGFCGGWDYGITPKEKYDKCSVITFGNRRKIQGVKCSDEKREIVAREMARYRRIRA